MAGPEAPGFGPPDVLRPGCGPLLLEANPDVVTPPEPEAVDCVRLRKRLSQELVQGLRFRTMKLLIYHNERRSTSGLQFLLEAMIWPCNNDNN